MLETGQSVPQFSLPDQNGKIHNINDYKDQWVILYFYPKDLTPGCTTEACNFQEALPDFNAISALAKIHRNSIKSLYQNTIFNSIYLAMNIAMYAKNSVSGRRKAITARSIWASCVQHSL